MVEVLLHTSNQMHRQVHALSDDLHMLLPVWHMHLVQASYAACRLCHSVSRTQPEQRCMHVIDEDGRQLWEGGGGGYLCTIG